MKRILHVLPAFIIYHLSFNIGIATAQTAKVYRGGALLSTHTTLASASAAANAIGDSIIVSAHTFKEHNVPVMGGQTWQGTYTPTDSTVIDAEKKGRVMDASSIRTYRAAIIRNIIFTNGYTIYPAMDGGGISNTADSIVFKGYSVIRNCRASRNGGGVSGVLLYDFVKIYNNVADSFGGGSVTSRHQDNVEISYNVALYGGGVAGLPNLNLNSANVKVCNNTATIAGGGAYGMVYSNDSGYQITNNQAPKGAGICGRSLPLSIYAIDVRNAYIYNPAPDGSRQNEIYIDGGNMFLEGCWFGKSDTVGLISQNLSYPYLRDGKYATTSWSVNRGAALTAKDTLFPIGAAFVYNDGTPMPPNACPWLVGKFSASTGTMLTLNPTVNAKDTMSSMFRTYAYPVGGSGSKPIDFLCIVDQDTFRVTKLVWGRTPLGIKENIEEQNVLVYPNPAKDIIHINGAAIGSNIALYDLAGRVMKNEKVTTSNAVLDVKGLPAGTYILKITTEEGKEGSAAIILNGE